MRLGQSILVKIYNFYKSFWYFCRTKLRVQQNLQAKKKTPLWTGGGGFGGPGPPGLQKGRQKRKKNEKEKGKKEGERKKRGKEEKIKKKKERGDKKEKKKEKRIKESKSTWREGRHAVSSVSRGSREKKLQGRQIDGERQKNHWTSSNLFHLWHLIKKCRVP